MFSIKCGIHKVIVPTSLKSIFITVPHKPHSDESFSDIHNAYRPNFDFVLKYSDIIVIRSCLQAVRGFHQAFTVPGIDGTQFPFPTHPQSIT